MDMVYGLAAVEDAQEIGYGALAIKFASLKKSLLTP